jgi:hypothetical protein
MHLLKSRKLLICYSLIVLLIGTSYVCMAWNGYPMGETDSLWFPPAAVSYHNGMGLMNYLHEPSHQFDQTGQMRFLFYPPGFPLILSKLMIDSTGRGAMIGITFINFISLILSAILFYKVSITESGKFSRSAFVLSTLGLFAISTYLGAFRLGRPDFLGTVYILLILFIQKKLPVPYREIFSAVILGLLAWTHPVGTFFTCAQLGMHYAWYQPFSKWIGSLSAIYGGGLAIFLLCMAASPYGFYDSFEGIYLHANATLIHGTAHHFVKYWIMHTYATCYGILFIATAILLVWYFWKKKDEIQTRWGVLLFAIIFLLILEHFIAEAWDRSYNLWVLSPLFIAFVLQVCSGKLPEFKPLSKTLSKITVVILVLCSIGYIHTLGLFHLYLNSNYRLEQARQDFAEITKNRTGIIGVSKSLWMLSENYPQMRSFGLKPLELHAPAELIFLQQRHTDLKTPPEISGYKLLQHNFLPQQAVLFGIPLSPTVPGYYFAVYERLP